MITDNSAPANNFDNPNTEKKAALNAISRAESPTRLEKFLLCSNTIFSYLLIINIENLIYVCKFCFLNCIAEIVFISVPKNGIDIIVSFF